MSPGLSRHFDDRWADAVGVLSAGIKQTIARSCSPVEFCDLRSANVDRLWSGLYLVVEGETDENRYRVVIHPKFEIEKSIHLLASVMYGLASLRFGHTTSRLSPSIIH